MEFGKILIDKYLIADLLYFLGLPINNYIYSFLAAAYELRSGIPEGASPKSAGPDIIRAMATELWLDFLGVRLNSKKAEDIKFVINLVTPVFIIIVFLPIKFVRLCQNN